MIKSVAGHILINLLPELFKVLSYEDLGVVQLLSDQQGFGKRRLCARLSDPLLMFRFYHQHDNLNRPL